MEKTTVAVDCEKTETPGRPDILERTLAFSVLAVNLYRRIMRNDAGQVIARQFLRAATSIGANVHEAQAGQSKADFIAKVSIAYKEARETAYWLMLMQRAGIDVPEMHSQARDECSQICRILASILMTSKGLRGCVGRHQPSNNS
jgi:four helix bundle protein